MCDRMLWSSVVFMLMVLVVMVMIMVRMLLVMQFLVGNNGSGVGLCMFSMGHSSVSRVFFVLVMLVV
jgi:hypothetical protein